MSIQSRPISRPWRRYLRFSVRGLIVVVLLVGCWLGWIVRIAHIQQAAVAAIRKASGSVSYDWEFRDGKIIRGGKPRAPRWLVDLAGIDYFGHVTKVSYFLKGLDVAPANTSTVSQVDAAMARLNGFSELSQLELRLTDVTDAGLAHLKGLTKLSYLDLSFTRVTDAGLVHLKRLTNLAEVCLDHTRVTDSGLSHLNGLANVSKLGLNGTRITDAGLVHLKDLTNISALDLSGTLVTDAGLLHLKRLTNLSKLDLERTQVTDAGLVHLKGLTKLAVLCLSNSQVTDGGLAHLKGPEGRSPARLNRRRAPRPHGRGSTSRSL
jgi:Leucine Rich repeat